MEGGKKQLNLQDFLYRKDESQFNTIDFDGDKYSIVNLYKHIFKQCFPPKKLGIEVNGCFLRITSEKEYKVVYYFICIIYIFYTLNILYSYILHIQKGKKLRQAYLTGLYKNNAWGVSYFTKKMKELAEQ